MTFPKNMMGVLALYFSFFSDAVAGDVGGQCEKQSFEILELQLSSCMVNQGVAIGLYRSQMPLSDNDNIFEQRAITFARGTDRAIVFEHAGIRLKSNGTLYFLRNMLMPPPLQDQVIKRIVHKGNRGYLGWKIFTETDFYPGPGGELGFSVRCSTAVRIGEQSTIDAVGECYYFEEWPRFLHMLSTLEKNENRNVHTLRPGQQTQGNQVENGKSPCSFGAGRCPSLNFWKSTSLLDGPSQ